MMARLRTVRLVFLVSAALLAGGCSFGRNVVATARTVARLTAAQGNQPFRVSDLRADVQKPHGAAEILMASFLVKSPQDEQLVRFNNAFCHDLSLRVTRLPEVRGQVPGWVADEAMRQLGIHTLALSPQTAMKVARLAGRRYVMTGDLDRLGGRLRARVGIYNVKTRERVGEVIELVGTPQEFLNREGWLAEQIAQRIGVKLTAADRAWLDRREFRDLADFNAIARLITHNDKGHTERLAARRDREPASLLVETAWLQCRAWNGAKGYMAALQRAHQRFPEEPNFLSSIIEERFRLGDKAGAKQVLDEYLRLHPGSWQGLNLRARYYHYMERGYAASLPATESLGVLYSDCWLSWHRCSYEALQLAYQVRAGHYVGEMNAAQRRVFSRGMKEALAAGERALALNSRDVSLLTHMIDVYRENGMPAKAHQVFDQAIAIDPGHIAAYDALAVTYKKGYENDEQRMNAIIRQSLRAPAKTWYDLQAQAENAFILKQKDLGLELFKRAFAAAGNQPCPALHLSYADEIGDQMGRWDEAEKHARIALRAEASVKGYLTLGHALAELKRPTEALAAVTEAKRLDPNDPDCDAALAVVMNDLGQRDAAFGQMRRAYEKDRRNVQYLAEIGGAYLSRGEYDKAWQVMQGIKQQPFWEDSGIDMRAVGDLHALKGYYREAIKYYDKHLEEHAGDPNSLTHGALCYMMLKDCRHAAERWREVLVKEPSNAESHLGLAVSLSMSGDNGKAAAEARKAVALDSKIADPKCLMKDRYWPAPLAQEAARLAAGAKP